MTERICLKCGKAVKERKPVYLLKSPSGRIDGPYHAVCAYFVNLEERGGECSAAVVPADDATLRALLGRTT